MLFCLCIEFSRILFTPCGVGSLSHNITPDRAVQTAGIIDDNYLACFHIIDEVADRSFNGPARNIMNGESFSTDGMSGNNSLYSEKSADNSQLVHGI